MKIVNVSDKPYELMFDGRVMATMLPNEPWDFPQALAEHAIRKSEILDDEGQVAGHRVKLLDEVDKSSLKMRCPLEQTGLCSGAGAFSSLRELAEHMQTHKTPSVTPVGKRDEIRL